MNIQSFLITVLQSMRCVGYKVFGCNVSNFLIDTKRFFFFFISFFRNFPILNSHLQVVGLIRTIGSDIYFQKKRMQQHVFLLHIVDPRTSEYERAARMAELEKLVQTFGGYVILEAIQKKQVPDYSTYVGK